jgi:hypothetical protein
MVSSSYACDDLWRQRWRIAGSMQRDTYIVKRTIANILDIRFAPDNDAPIASP